MLLGASWWCLVVLAALGGAWRYCVCGFVLFGAALRCLMVLDGSWWCLVVLGCA